MSAARRANGQYTTTAMIWLITSRAIGGNDEMITRKILLKRQIARYHQGRLSIA
jgi:hypothetical protein